MPTLSRSGLGAIRDIGFVSIGKYSQYAITLVTIPLCARLLGPSGLGLLAIAMSTYFLGALATDMGITTYLGARVNEAGLSRLRGAYAVVRGTWLLLFAVCYALAEMFDAHSSLVMVTLGLFSGSISAVGDDWVLVGKQRFGIIALQGFLGRVLYLVLLVALLPLVRTPHMAMLCLMVSSLVPVALSWLVTIRSYGYPSRPDHPARLLRIGGPVLAARMLENTYEQGAVALFTPALSHHSLGLFSASDRPVQAAGSFLDSIGWSLLPRLAARVDTPDEFWRTTGKLVRIVAALGAFGATVACVAAPWAIPLLFGDEYRQAIVLLQVEAWVLPGMAVASFLSTAVLPIHQDTRGVVLGSALGAVVAGITLCIAFATHHALALVIGIVAAETVVAVFYLLRIRTLKVRPLPEKVLA